jgi:choline kinase
MKAIILAAGRGSRMGGLTDRQPKCLSVLAGQTLLDWQLDAVRGAGIEEIGIVRGYRSSQLELSGLHYFENVRWAESNMVVSLACASHWLRTDVCVVTYSDIVFPASIVRVLARAEGDIVITYDVNWKQLWQRRFADPLVDAETFRVDSNGRLLEIGRKPTAFSEIEGQYMGLLRFTPRGWSAVEEFLATLKPDVLDRLDMTTLIQKLIERGIAISAVPVTQPWYEVDSKSDLGLYEQLANSRGGRLWPEEC